MGPGLQPPVLAHRSVFGACGRATTPGRYARGGCPPVLTGSASRGPAHGATWAGNLGGQLGRAAWGPALDQRMGEGVAASEWRDAAMQNIACTRMVGSLSCASQQWGVAPLSAFLGRFLPKLGGAARRRHFFVHPLAGRCQSADQANPARSGACRRGAASIFPGIRDATGATPDRADLPWARSSRGHPSGAGRAAEALGHRNRSSRGPRGASVQASAAMDQRAQPLGSPGPQRHSAGVRPRTPRLPLRPGSRSAPRYRPAGRRSAAVARCVSRPCRGSGRFLSAARARPHAGGRNGG